MVFVYMKSVFLSYFIVFIDVYTGCGVWASLMLFFSVASYCLDSFTLYTGVYNVFQLVYHLFLYKIKYPIGIISEKLQKMALHFSFDLIEFGELSG